MDYRHPQGLKGSASLRGDDFTLIKGIGPGIKDRLHDAGILTFAQLGASSPEKIAAAVTGLSAKRIAREKWIGQARRLASRQKPARRRTKSADLGGRQQYATFTVELLLDADKSVRRTRVTHIQSGAESRWAGWQAARLTNFLVQSAALQLPPTEMAPQVTVVAEPIPTEIVAELVASKVIAGLVASKAIVQPYAAKVEVEPVVSKAVAQLAASEVAAEPLAAKAVVEPVVSKAVAQPAASKAITDLADTLRLSRVEIVPVDTDSPSDAVPYGLPFNVLIALDLSDVAAPSNAPIVYNVTLSAKRFGSRTRQMVGQSHGTLVSSETITVPVEGTTLAQGTYLLTALVTIEPRSTQLSARAGRKVAKWTGLLEIC